VRRIEAPRQRNRRIGFVSALSPTLKILANSRRRALILAALGAVGFSGAVILLGEPFTAWIAAETVLVLAGIWLLTQSQPISAAEISP